jgi:hypothetical protein
MFFAAGLAMKCALAQTTYQPQSVSPPKDAGYVLADGTVQIVGWDDLSGVFRNLNSLYTKTHPGTRFKYVPGNLFAPQHSLIFGETAFAPIGMEFSSNLGSAYRAQVHAPYLRMTLSKEGQQAIASDPKRYLPLNAVEVATELSKLD